MTQEVQQYPMQPSSWGSGSTINQASNVSYLMYKLMPELVIR